MNKVTIEIDKNGWSTKVELNGKVYIEKHEKTSFGSQIVKGDFERNKEIPDELWECLGSLEAYETMVFLSSIED